MRRPSGVVCQLVGISQRKAGGQVLSRRGRARTTRSCWSCRPISRVTGEVAEVAPYVTVSPASMLQRCNVDVRDVTDTGADPEPDPGWSSQHSVYLTTIYTIRSLFRFAPFLSLKVWNLHMNDGDFGPVGHLMGVDRKCFFFHSRSPFKTQPKCNTCTLENWEI